MRKKMNYSLEELIKKNKEELLKDQVQMEKIEKQLDERISKVK